MYLLDFWLCKSNEKPNKHSPAFLACKLYKNERLRVSVFHSHDHSQQHKREIFQMISCLRWSQTIRSAANNTTDNFSHNKIYNCWAGQLWVTGATVKWSAADACWATSIAYHRLIHEKWKGKTSHLLLFNSSSQEWVSNSTELFQLLNRWKFPALWNTISWFSEYFFLQFAP